MLLYQGREPSAACGEGHGKAAVSLQPMEVNDAAEMHLQSSEVPTPKKENASKKCCDPVGKPTLEQVPTSRPMESIAHTGAGWLVGPVGGLCWSSLFLKGCSP